MLVTRNPLPLAAFAVIATTIVASSTDASLVTYTSLNEWTASTGEVTAIDFGDLPLFTPVSTQYSCLGVNFVPGDDFTFANALLFPSDGVGLDGGFGPGGGIRPIEMEFSTPITSIGVRFPSLIEFDLYSNGVKIGSTDWFNGFGQGGWAFAGVISDTPFDRVVLTNQVGATTIDTLFFGGAIPGPGGIAVLVGGAVVGAAGRRRRR